MVYNNGLQERADFVAELLQDRTKEFFIDHPEVIAALKDTFSSGVEMVIDAHFDDAAMRESVKEIIPSSLERFNPVYLSAEVASGWKTLAATYNPLIQICDSVPETHPEYALFSEMQNGYEKKKRRARVRETIFQTMAYPTEPCFAMATQKLFPHNESYESFMTDTDGTREIVVSQALLMRERAEPEKRAPEKFVRALHTFYVKAAERAYKEIVKAVDIPLIYEPKPPCF